MPLQQLIAPTDTFQVVRDKVAQILADEVANQMAIAGGFVGLDPDDWNLEIYVERANPWEKWLNDTTLANKVPVVNVWFDSDSFDMGQGNVVQYQQAEGSINIDCYGFGISADDGGTGHIAGDEEAARASQSAMRLVRRILMASEYTYLELRGVVARRWVISRTTFQPQQDARSAQRIVGSRLVLGVKYLEDAQQYQGAALECTHVDLKRNADGFVLSQLEYGDACAPTPPDACTCTPTHLDDTFWSGTDIDWVSAANEWRTPGLTVPSGYILTAVNGWNVNTFRPTVLELCMYPPVAISNQFPNTVSVFVDDTDGALLGTAQTVFTDEGIDEIVTVTVTLNWSGSATGAGIGTIHVDPAFYLEGPSITCIEFES